MKAAKIGAASPLRRAALATPRAAAAEAPRAQAALVTALCEPDGYLVRTAEGARTVDRAPSCMLVPRVDDEVWLLPASDGTYVIGAVLRRAAGAPGEVALPGRDVTLSASGSLHVTSGATLELGARDHVRIHGPSLEVSTLRTRVASQVVELFASRVEAGVERARVVANKIDAAVDSLALRLQRSFRWVAELDQVRAGQVDVRAEGNVRVHGDSAFVSAEHVVQVRGEEVHLS